MKVAFVDDEKSMLIILKKMIAKIPGVEIAGAFQSTGEAYKFLKVNKIDMLFVDIKMSEENGMDFARRISPEIPGTDIVFLTSFKEHALEAFDVYAFDYIVKPVSQERLERTISRAIQKHGSSLVSSEQTMNKLFVYCLGGLELKSLDGQTIKFNSSKSAELFAFLLLSAGRYISKWSVMENIFRGMPRQNAETYLNTTVYKLRKALEPYGMKEVVDFSSESYKLENKDIYIDFMDFENRVTILGTINELNLEDAVRLEQLFSGELFGDKDYFWALPYKERLFEMYWNFAKKLGIYHMENNNLIQALQIFKKLAVKNELDEEINCFLMQIYAAQKDRVLLIKQYERYKKSLHTELGISPGNDTTKLYCKLIKSLQ
jgi:two-component SAPR family response regulator